MVIGVEDGSDRPDWLEPHRRKDIPKLLQNELHSLLAAVCSLAFMRVEAAVQPVEHWQELLDEIRKRKVVELLFFLLGAFPKVFEFGLFPQEAVIKLFPGLDDLLKFLERDRW